MYFFNSCHFNCYTFAMRSRQFQNFTHTVNTLFVCLRIFLLSIIVPIFFFTINKSMIQILITGYYFVTIHVIKSNQIESYKLIVTGFCCCCCCWCIDSLTFNHYRQNTVFYSHISQCRQSLSVQYILFSESKIDASNWMMFCVCALCTLCVFILINYICI